MDTRSVQEESRNAVETHDRFECGFSGAKKDAPAFTFVSAGYYDAIAAVGGIPIVLPPLANETDLKRILDLLDGVVMVGGPILIRAATASCSIRRSARWSRGARISTAC